MQVEIVQWPEERRRRSCLQDAGRPRLLLVEPTCEPPVCADPLEDWAFESAPAVEVVARSTALQLVADQARNREPEPPPVLTDDDVLRLGDEWVALPPLEGRLMQVLLERPGAVVSRERLTEVGWADGADRNNLDVHIMRLRKRLEPLGIRLRTVRSRGYALQR